MIDSDRPSLYGEDDFKIEIRWRNVFLMLYIHTVAITTFFLPPSIFWTKFVFWFAGNMTAYGTTVGAHRLFTHRTFKANLPLRILLMVSSTMAFQNDILVWARDHRVHHKYTDTNADPHNSKRGLFFSHIGWLMCSKHPDIKKFGSRIDMSDLESDPVVQFQKK